jgi:hypothetical protein
MAAYFGIWGLFISRKIECRHEDGSGMAVSGFVFTRLG